MGKTGMSAHAYCGLVVLGLALSATGSNLAATTPIYKCLDKNLGLLYTDEPCNDGELLNIRAGDADPAAVARLEPARDALDQGVARRIADARSASAQRGPAAWYATEDGRIAYDYATDNVPYDYSAQWWFPGMSRHHLPRSRKALKPRRIPPMASHMAPRR